jgi:hypothetical protein
MAREVTQIVETSDGESKGTVTVITTDENGTQRASTREYDNNSSTIGKQSAIEKATQDSLSKY